eukprot:Clim_evm71s147 gene=Clim_evmTU71s147
MIDQLMSVNYQLVFVGHFVLVNLALWDNTLGEGYLVSNALMLVMGGLGTKDDATIDEMWKYLSILIFTIFNDIILFFIYGSPGGGAAGFSFAMAVINMFLKFFSAVLVHQEITSKGGNPTSGVSFNYPQSSGNHANSGGNSYQPLSGDDEEQLS